MDLSNTVLKNKAMSELMHLKTKKAPGFRQASLFKKIMMILECHQFRLGMRRFAIDLFDRSVMRQIVLDEESSEENEESDSDDDSASEGRTERQPSVSNVSGPAGSE
jgi:rapamycin-insensitive companion of mTOR